MLLVLLHLFQLRLERFFGQCGCFIQLSVHQSVYLAHKPLVVLLVLPEGLPMLMLPVRLCRSELPECPFQQWLRNIHSINNGSQLPFKVGLRGGARLFALATLAAL
ncbi:hypothetical protein AUJ46_01050 [Candidatus Peregrinibacteria bacterium CG1_02_54_53]|nr:MAG: hypothetical protein AUJ46_01050 [Candidatus Peregrinibacteria bacterium CG1_02_54_53]